MSWANNESHAILERTLRAEAVSARHTPSQQLRLRILRAVEHTARTLPASQRMLWPRARDRRNIIAMVTGMSAVIALATIATLLVQPTQLSHRPATSLAASGGRSNPQGIADALPGGTTTVVAQVSAGVAAADDPLRHEARALQHDLGRALAFVRHSVGLGSGAANR